MDDESHDHASRHQEDVHARHVQMLDKKGFSREQQDYRIPDVMLTDLDGRRVSLRAVLDDEVPVMLNFIFTTCTTICPVLSASFSQVRKNFAADAGAVRLVSISIDPEHDTPQKLRDYAQRFQVSDGWMFLTGDLEDINSVLKAFDAYRRDKMNHIPLTFLHAPAQTPWVRIEGFPSAGDLVSEYHALTRHNQARGD